MWLRHLGATNPWAPYFSVLPHVVLPSDWSEEELAELQDRYVRPLWRESNVTPMVVSRFAPAPACGSEACWTVLECQTGCAEVP